MAASSSSGTPKPAKKAAKKAPVKKTAPSGKTGPVTNQQVHDELVAQQKFLREELPGIVADTVAGVTGSQHRKIMNKVKDNTTAIRSLEEKIDKLYSLVERIEATLKTARSTNWPVIVAALVGLVFFGGNLANGGGLIKSAAIGLGLALIVGVVISGVRRLWRSDIVHDLRALRSERRAHPDTTTGGSGH